MGPRISGLILLVCAACAAWAQPAREAETLETAAALDDLVYAQTALHPADPTEARIYAQRAIDIKERILGPNHPAVARSVVLFAKLEQRVGDYAGAQTHFERAMAIYGRDPGPQSVELADTGLDFCEVLIQKGDEVRPRQIGEQSLAIYEAHYGPVDASVVRALSVIASSYLSGMNYSGARPLLERAAVVQDQLRAPANAALLGQFAFVLSHTGELARALQLQERAVAITQKDSGAHSVAAAHALTNLGRMLYDLGDFPAGDRRMAEALTALEAALGPDAADIADVHIHMGNGARHAERYADAAKHYESALSIYEKRFGPENTRVAGALDNLAQMLEMRGDFDGARQRFERALAIQERELGPRHVWTANLIQGMAKLAADRGDFKESRRLYERNLEIWREQLGPSHPYVIASMSQLAEVEARLGQPREAFGTAAEAGRLRRGNVLATVRYVEEREALNYASLQNSALDTVLRLADQAPREAWNALIQNRALVLDELGARRHAIHYAGGKDVAKIAADLAGAREHLAKLVVQGRGTRTAGEYGAKVEEQRSLVKEFERGLAAQSAKFRVEHDRLEAGFAEIAAALPPGSALVAFARYGDAAMEVKSLRPTPSYLAFVLRGGESSPELVRLGAAAPIDLSVTRWRAEIDREAASFGRSAGANEVGYRTAGAALRQKVWDPLLNAVGSSRRVYIVPDGALQTVNFAALPVAGEHYLVEKGPLLHSLSAERDIIVPPGVSPLGVSGAGGLLAVGNPAFQNQPESTPSLVSQSVFRGAHSTCTDFSSVRFANLPASAAEASAIESIWKQRGGEGVLLTGGHATESAVKQAAVGKRVLHLATHAFFVDGDCMRPKEENPLLRAGLALAGANHRADAGAREEDGILTAEEVTSLDLDGAEWVVLSGCDTGAGEVKSGEGVLGLRRAFQIAGARTVITSLWPVDDEQTRQWMVALYRSHFTKGLDTAESVRAAAVGRLQARRAGHESTHPFYWAGFVAAGDWR
jgi:CHAT domain-containing protein/tetratricopeptide (TPR) repeat protein